MGSGFMVCKFLMNLRVGIRPLEQDIRLAGCATRLTSVAGTIPALLRVSCFGLC